MKPKTIFAFVIAACVAGGAIWWITQPPPPAPQPVAAATPAPKPQPPKPAAPTPQVMAPVVAPIVTPPAPSAPQPVAEIQSPAPADNDPQKDLSTAIPDMINLVQSGDIVTLMNNYMSPEDLAKIPAEQKAQMEQQMQTMMQSPQGQQMIQIMGQFLGSMKDMSPTMNATGDQAVYDVPPPAGMAPPGANVPATIPVTFVKEGGRWYIKQGPGGF